MILRALCKVTWFCLNVKHRLNQQLKQGVFLRGVGGGSVVLYGIWRDLCKSFLPEN